MAHPQDVLMQAPGRERREERKWRTLLDGRWYNFRLAWNVRDRRWYFDVATDTGTSVVVGLGVEAGVSLLGAVPRAELPPGQIYVEDVGGLFRAPTLTSWQSYSRMWYRPASVVALVAGTSAEVL